MLCQIYHILNDIGDPKLSIWFSRDVKCSRLHLLNILFRNLSLGKLCNLMEGGKKIFI